MDWIMKRILVIGIILLALIALTGVVSALPTGKVDVKADIQPTLELTVSGSISNWVMNPPFVSEIGGVTIDVVNNGYPSYQITVADKMDQDPCGQPKPSGTAGAMTLYKNSACAAGWGYTTSTPPEIVGVGHLNVKASPADWVDLTGTDQTLVIQPDEWTNSYVVFFSQDPGAGAGATKPASVYGGNGYRIVVTFTAIPN
jgi:hypothetical protein